MWKKQEIYRKSPMKMCKKAISGIFGSAFLKNRTRPYFGHCYLCKQSEKTNDEISRKCQKLGCFRHFWPVKYVFPKYKVQLEKSNKYHYSSKNPLFPRFLESSGYKNQFHWQNEPCLMVGIVISNVLKWKNNEI